MSCNCQIQISDFHFFKRNLIDFNFKIGNVANGGKKFHRVISFLFILKNVLKNTFLSLAIPLDKPIKFFYRKNSLFSLNNKLRVTIS